MEKPSSDVLEDHHFIDQQSVFRNLLLSRFGQMIDLEME